MKFGAHSLLDALDRASADGQTHQWITLDT